MKPLRDMTEPELKEVFHRVAERVKWSLPKNTLFVVLAMEESEGPGISQYVSNCDRATMSALLRETADRFDRNDIVPRVEQPPHPNASPAELEAVRKLERLAQAATDGAVAMRELSELAETSLAGAGSHPAIRKLTVCLNRVHKCIMEFGELKDEIHRDGAPDTDLEP